MHTKIKTNTREIKTHEEYNEKKYKYVYTYIYVCVYIIYVHIHIHTFIFIYINTYMCIYMVFCKKQIGKGRENISRDNN